MRTDIVTPDLLTNPFPEAQAAIAARIEEILDACVMKDFDRLAAYHLAGPKFSKFDDIEPLDRQDDRTAMRSEVDAFSSIENLAARIESPKIDVFGPVAIVTGVFQAAFRAGGEQQSARTRTTVVFVDAGDGDWLIAHEHHSPFVASM
jgi:ketosteroid isomerase-like protein